MEETTQRNWDCYFSWRRLALERQSILWLERGEREKERERETERLRERERERERES